MERDMLALRLHGDEPRHAGAAMKAANADVTGAAPDGKEPKL